ncbi:DUF4177 domain-containing protein [Paenibacillus paeoniae]|uniref:DUF4177 domain-containing protein n=1 Tax=Paenibacillus paeoniae TaxID=2292705 RepID=A0A371PJ56_9BACL|nr:DUF4177 domain-containing protein [Paenibacillus paeoniae]REK75679.1 DUF4177 domain-containing protein [Paenibacillus paeoniae]
MYEYKFVKVDLSNWNSKPKEDYQEIIADHAKDGWRFVQIFAPAIKGTGFATYFEIIFEKPVN